MAAVEAIPRSLFFLSHFSSKPLSIPKRFSCLKPHNSSLTQNLSLTLPFPTPPIVVNPSKLTLRFCSALQEVAVEEEKGETQLENQRRKLFVLNLPWSLTASDIKDLFNQCGTVTDVEIIKQKDGKSRGFAFVTMSSAEEAQEAIDKFDSSYQKVEVSNRHMWESGLHVEPMMQEVSGRIIRVEFAKRFKRPSPPPPARPISGETRHKLYVSNLAWKARSSHLRELFSTSFKPVSTRVVFDSPSGRSAGYGFVSFVTKEEAEAALSALDGKELMGRPLRLKFSEKNNGKSDGEAVGDASE
ncbi:RNA recognition motif domain [Dillenia turbinata]|uniref:RNA recognition motif domain n=1 Tax=Dillenia turbinata TaxID=194707 RepID=A0AAN8ZRI0_9MAGN